MTMNPYPDYLAALHGSVYFPSPEVGCLRLTGADRVDFLQRQTTNDLRGLAAGRTVTTVLTSPTARILDVLTLFALDEAVFALTLEGRGAITARELRSKIFFMDKVAVTDASAEFCQFDLDGPVAEAVLYHLGATALPGLNEITTISWPDAAIQVAARPGFGGLGYRLLAPTAQAETLVGQMQKAGAVRLSPEMRQVLRVETGLPGLATELTDEYNPLEANLHAYISEHKGCYTGQEIIARQISYDKVTRRLVGLRLAAPLAVGTKLMVEGRPAGEITSVALSPRFGSIALAFVKRPHTEPGSVLTAQDADITPTTVVPLPFV